MSKTELANKFTRTLGKVKLGAKKYAPEVLVIAGVAGVVTSTVMACKATTKASAITEKFKEDMHNVHLTAAAAGIEVIDEQYSEDDLELIALASTSEEIKSYTEEDLKKDTVIVYAKTALDFVKLYGPSIVVGALSLTAILSSHHLLRKRNVALAAAYATVDRGFKEYRGRVIERFGKELDRELKYNIKAKAVQEVTVDDEGKETVTDKTIEVADVNFFSEYGRFFDESNPNWSKDAEDNKRFLLLQQNWANEKLQRRGYVFLNEVYDMLGFDKTKAGQCVGWVYDKNNQVGDNFIDFGMLDMYKENTPIAANMNERKRAFINGHERSIYLEFNVDGNILDDFAM